MPSLQRWKRSEQKSRRMLRGFVGVGSSGWCVVLHSADDVGDIAGWLCTALVFPQVSCEEIPEKQEFVEGEFCDSMQHCRIGHMPLWYSCGYIGKIPLNADPNKTTSWDTFVPIAVVAVNPQLLKFQTYCKTLRIVLHRVSNPATDMLQWKTIRCSQPRCNTVETVVGITRVLPRLSLRESDTVSSSLPRQTGRERDSLTARSVPATIIDGKHYQSSRFHRFIDHDDDE